VKTDTARPETTEVTVGVTATDTGTGTEAEEATETDMAALVGEEMMIMGLDQAATTAVMTVGGVKTTLDLLVGIGMMGHPEETVVEEGEVAVVVVVVEREWEHLNVGLRPQKVHSHCRRGNGKLLDGMFMLLGMNNTLLCKQSRLVRIHTIYLSHSCSCYRFSRIIQFAWSQPYANSSHPGDCGPPSANACTNLRYGHRK
jgi:hypothetical protein